MENEVSMNSRAEVTTRYAKAYVKAAKGDKGRILDEVVGVTGWSRDNARRRLSVAEVVNLHIALSESHCSAVW